MSLAKEQMRVAVAGLHNAEAREDGFGEISRDDEAPGGLESRRLLVPPCSCVAAAVAGQS